MYKILKKKNYCGETIFLLTKDGLVLGGISQKNMTSFISKKIGLSDSEAIEKYLKNNNL